jgi:hypothetical protein
MNNGNKDPITLTDRIEEALRRSASHKAARFANNSTGLAMEACYSARLDSKHEEALAAVNRDLRKSLEEKYYQAACDQLIAALDDMAFGEKKP